MRKTRLVLLALFACSGLLIWQLPSLLMLVPSRYVAAYLPVPLQGLVERQHVEMLPTVDANPDTTSLLAESEHTAESGPGTTPGGERTPLPISDVAAESGQPPKRATTPELMPATRLTATPTVVPAPPAARLSNVTHHFQTWNNCGPATLAMALSYFGVIRGQEQTASILKPDPEDRNVSPYEMEAYVNLQTDLSALSRTNGDIGLLKRLLAAGYPVIVELGLDPPGEYRWMGWYGHYLLVVAYDDTEQQVWVYDSWFGTSEVPGENADANGRVITYDQLDIYWRQFDRNYIVLFESEEQQNLTEIVGTAVDDNVMWRAALERAQEEVAIEQDNAFLWFNVGTAYNALGEYEKAAAAFDQARALGLPWRMLWYQFGPYEAYYQVGRYEDVILLADVTLQNRPYFEESYYYRGMAQAALGNVKQGQADLERAVKRNPNFTPATEALAQLGA